MWISTWCGLFYLLTIYPGLGKDFMTPMVITVKGDATIMEIIDHMLKHNVKRVPVLNKENRVMGMLYERDIFYFITNAMQGAMEVHNDE